MKALLDFLPIVFFFAAFKLKGIYVATAVLMAATVIQMLIVYAIDRKLQPMQKATLLLILVFGALTLVLQDDRYIKWKPTVLYGAMSVAMAVALWGFGKNVLHMLLGGQLTLPRRMWTHLSVAWILYCAFMAALNAYVALYFSTEAWVDFKLWGYVFPIAFLVAQGLYIAPHLKTDESSEPSP